MQYVNDDMDELFRKAAENYPLDTKGADWNKVLVALQNKTETEPDKKRGDKRRFLWLLLLLPLGVICNQLYSPSDLGDKEISQIKKEDRSSSNKIVTTSAGSEENKIGIAKDDHTTDHTTPATIINPDGTHLNNPNTKNKIENSFNSPLPIQGSSNQLKTNYSERTTNGSSFKANAFSSAREGKQSVNASDFTGEELSVYRNYKRSITLHKTRLDEFSTSVSRSMNPLFPSPSADSKQTIQVTTRKKFYAGLMGGVDATTVKFQKIENAGFTYGLLFGYQVNKKWSVETGAFLDRKYYYTEGKHINTSKMYLPANTWIDDAYGNCRMIEVPVSVKYNFSIHRNSNLFATVGSSSYIMQKENYTYNYYYGTTGPVPHKKEYKNSSTNLFSALSVSAGYTHHLGNFGDVRIEPYLKLPLSGMGIVDLPFLSTGLQVGFTRKF